MVPETLEEMVDVDGARLWTATEGEGRPVVWCHGGPGGTDLLEPAAAMVADIARVHRYEQRACGRSSGGAPYTMARWIADLDQLRQHWGHERWVVAGHSFGAALALAYALEHPDRTEAVVYLSCIVRLDGQPDWYGRYRDARLERLPEPYRHRFLGLRRRREQLAGSGQQDSAVEAELARLGAMVEFGDQVPQDRVALLEAEMTTANQVVNRELGADFQRFFASPVVRRGLRGLDRPVLLVHGEADLRPIAAVEALAAELPGGRFVTLDGVGHLPFWEAPERLREILRSFVLALPPPSHSAR